MAIFDGNIEIFKSKLGNLCKANKFRVSFLDPISNENLTFFVKSASLPGKTVGIIEVDYMGMKTKKSGDPVYADWTASFHLDEDFTARDMMENWMTIAADPITNTRGSSALVKWPIKIEQLGGSNDVIATYTLIGAFPNDITEVALDMASVDTISEFSVTFAYDYFIRGSV